MVGEVRVVPKPTAFPTAGTQICKDMRFGNSGIAASRRVRAVIRLARPAGTCVSPHCGSFVNWRVTGRGYRSGCVLDPLGRSQEGPPACPAGLFRSAFPHARRPVACEALTTILNPLLISVC